MSYKKIVSVVLATIMMLTVVPQNVAAADEAVLVTIGVGEIYEFRNLTNRSQKVRFEGNEESFGDCYIYDQNGNGDYVYRGTAIGWTQRGSGGATERTVPTGGMLVIEIRTGSPVVVKGGADVFKITQLVTPVLYVKTMTAGVTEEFVNSGGGSHNVSYTTRGYPFYNIQGGSALTVYADRADGTSTKPVTVGAASGSVSLKLGDKLVVKGNQLKKDWSIDLSGSYTAFSGQPYRLTVDGQRSYPPGMGQDFTPFEENEFEDNPVKGDSGETATDPVINSYDDPSIFIEQSNSKRCTLAATVVMMRRWAIIDGRLDWASITEKALESKAWVRTDRGEGIIDRFPHEEMNFKRNTNDFINKTTDDKKAELISLLREHPEGVMVWGRYGSDPDWRHAVLLTGYDTDNDTFYCFDPVSTHWSKGIIPLVNSSMGNNQENIIGNLRNYWRITNRPSGKGITSPWASEQVSTAIAANLVPPVLQYNYMQAITRAEFCALAVAVYESIKGEITGRTTFSDTNDINVQKAASIGVVSGVGNNRFDPNAQLTREQATVILSRLALIMDKPFPLQPTSFGDIAEIASWAIEFVGRVQVAGIMSGVGDNNFDPRGKFTREQSIVTIMRLYDFVK